MAYLGLEQYLKMGILDQFVDLKQFVDKLYVQYATVNKTEINTIADKQIRDIVSRIAVEYEQKYRVTAAPCLITRYVAPGASFDWIQLLESDASKLAQVYILGGALWVFSRMYWRYWRLVAFVVDTTCSTMPTRTPRRHSCS